MASSIIHMCVANEINKILKRDNKKILIGSIAPDISKQIGETKIKSHFLTDDDIPNLDKFIIKYGKNLDDDFVLGYYIHLYTDYFWFKYFITDYVNKTKIYKLDGSIEECSIDKIVEYIYNDYTNLNIQLIDQYDLDLNIFYDDIPELNDIIKEIPMDRIGVIIEKAGIIIANSKIDKTYIFDITYINKFIDICVNALIDDLKIFV